MMTFEQKHYRDWYYRNAIIAIHKYVTAWMHERERDRDARVESLLSACERDAEMCAELIEQNADRLRFINWKCDKRGKPISCEVVWNNDTRYIEAKRASDAKRRERRFDSPITGRAGDAETVKPTGTTELQSGK